MVIAQSDCAEAMRDRDAALVDAAEAKVAQAKAQAECDAAQEQTVECARVAQEAAATLAAEREANATPSCRLKQKFVFKMPRSD